MTGGSTLEPYAATFDLPVRTGVRVTRLARHGGEYLVSTDGPAFRCDNVVVASGTFGRTPYVPGFAGDLDPGILQLHSSAYKNPAQLRPGGVLVVGASHSGGDIAYEAGMAGHPTVLSGRIHGEVPFDVEGRPAHVIFPVLYFLAKHVLTVRTPLGRKLRPEVRRHGGPLIRVKRADLTRAGVAPSFPGLYFVGLAFQYAFASMLIGGAGRDAEYVVRHLCARPPAARWPEPVLKTA